MQLPTHWNVRLAESYDDVLEMLSWLRELPGAVALDTETTGLKWWTPRFTRMVQFGAGDTAWCISPEWWGRPIQQAMHELRESGRPVVFHNCKFDMHALESDGYPVPRWEVVHDTAVMDHLITPHASHRLKQAAARQLGHWAEAGQGLLDREFAATNTTWATIPVDNPVYVSYGGIDTLITWHLFEHLKPQLAAGGYRKVYEEEQIVQEIMYGAETRGMTIDPKYTEQLRHTWSKEAVVLADELSAAGIANPRSNKQLEEYLKSLGWEPDEFTPTGAAKLDKVILTQLAEVYPDIAPSILRFKRITKWSTVYLDRFLDDRDQFNRVHAGIHTLQARTGRMSITEPPLQTLPSKGSGGAIRRCVVPDPGKTLYAIDYDGQEAREFASYSQDPGMIACINRGDDLYAWIASEIYQVPVSKEDELRDRVKVVMLAWLYGAGVATLADHSGLSEQDVVGMLSRLFHICPNVRDLTGDFAIGGNYPGGPAITAAQRRVEEGLGYIHTWAGRRFSTPNADEDYKHVNGLMQGSGADVTKAGIRRLHKAGLGEYIIVPVHDEVLNQYPKDTAEEMAREAAACMTDNDWLVPLTVSTTGPLPNWGEAYQ